MPVGISRDKKAMGFKNPVNRVGVDTHLGANYSNPQMLRGSVKCYACSGDGHKANFCPSANTSTTRQERTT